MATIEITAIRLTGGTRHEHISHVWWTDHSAGRTGDDDRSTIVAGIEAKTLTAYVSDVYANKAYVGVVTPSSGSKYLRTYADGKWTDNLLALPRK